MPAVLCTVCVGVTGHGQESAKWGGGQYAGRRYEGLGRRCEGCRGDRGCHACQKAYAGKRAVPCRVAAVRDILLWMMTVDAPGDGAKNRLEKSFRRLDMNGRPARVMD